MGNDHEIQTVEVKNEPTLSLGALKLELGSQTNQKILELQKKHQIDLNLKRLSTEVQKPDPVSNAASNLANWLKENGFRGRKETWDSGNERNTEIGVKLPLGIAPVAGLSQRSDIFEKNPNTISPYVGVYLPKVAGFIPLLEMDPTNKSHWLVAAKRKLPGGSKVRIGFSGHQLSIDWVQPILEGDAGAVAASTMISTDTKYPESKAAVQYKVDF